MSPPTWNRCSTLAAQHGVAIIEDNAHGLGGTWRGRQLGTIGTLGTQSFHDTKNVHCGEGGALLLSDEILMGRAEIMREKGTDRARFLRGQVDKYSWQDIGSSYLPSELNAAVLDAQLGRVRRHSGRPSPRVGRLRGRAARVGARATTCAR